MQKVLNLVSDIKTVFQVTAAKHEDERAKLSQTNAVLVKENDQLRKANAELTMKVNSLTWKSFRNLGQQSHALIGSSIIRDVAEEKLADTEVICKRGAHVSGLKSTVENLTPGYETITLVVGGNDCDATTPKPVEEIVKSYSQLIDVAKEKCQTVRVSSICPRLISTDVQEKIDSVNAGLVATCSEKKETEFMDVTPCFRLEDGSVNDGYLLPDGIHITRQAMNKMAKKLKLQVKDTKSVVCEHVPDSTRTSTWQHRSRTVKRPAERTEKTDSYCFQCGEPNHVKDRCRHSHPLECRRCHRYGHKHKFCEFYDN
jgi:hypothetical protein